MALRRRKQAEDLDHLDDTARLARAIERLNNHRFIRIHNSTSRLMWFQFLRGLAFGFGTVIGASALVSVVVLLLSQVEVIPVLGGWATRIIEEIQAGQGPQYAPVEIDDQGNAVTSD